MVMLERLCSAGGYTLVTSLAPAPETLAALADRSHGEFDWTRARLIADRIRVTAGAAAAAIRLAPDSTGDVRWDNVIAAFGEKIADDAALPRPTWCAQIAVLAEPFTAAGTPAMLERFRPSVPAQFAARNLLFPANAIWRDL